MRVGIAEELDDRAGIERERYELGLLSYAHERLTHAMLGRASVGEIVQLIADLLGRPVLVYNVDEVLIASGAHGESQRGILDQVSAPGRRMDLAALVRGGKASGASVIVPPSPASGSAHRRLVCRLTVDGRVAGYLIALETGARFGRADSRIARLGAAVVTLALFSELRQSAAVAQAQQEFVDDLLTGGRDVDALCRRGLVHGVDLTRPHLLLRIERALPEQCAALATGLAGRLNLPSVVSAPDEGVLLVAAPPGPEADAARAVRDAVRAVLGEDGPIVVVSAICREPRDYPTAALELARVAEILRASATYGRVELAADLAVVRLIAASASSEDAIATARRLLAPILAADRAGHGELLPTLRALLAEDGGVRSAARRLGVHENTIRNRMAKVRNCSAIDPHRLDGLLDLRYCLQILDLAGDLEISTTTEAPSEGHLN
jgi:hypothetical protein